MEGEADWWVDDEKQHVAAGWTIYHRPYAIHGWKNTSATQPLRVIWIWWAEGDMKPEELNKGARFVNPSLAENAKTANPFAVPLPPVRSR